MSARREGIRVHPRQCFVLRHFVFSVVQRFIVLHTGGKNAFYGDRKSCDRHGEVSEPVLVLPPRIHDGKSRGAGFLIRNNRIQCARSDVHSVHGYPVDSMRGGVGRNVFEGPIRKSVARISYRSDDKATDRGTGDVLQTQCLQKNGKYCALP